MLNCRCFVFRRFRGAPGDKARGEICADYRRGSWHRARARAGKPQLETSRMKSSSKRNKQKGSGDSAREVLTLEQVRRRIRATVAGKLFGFDAVLLERGRAVITMRVQRKHIQIHGVVHGGILAALADTAGALAAYPMLPAGARLATVEMNINYLEPVVNGDLSGEGKVVRLGRNLVISECDITDHANRLVAKSLMTFAISASAKPRGRTFQKTPG